MKLYIYYIYVNIKGKHKVINCYLTFKKSIFYGLQRKELQWQHALPNTLTGTTDTFSYGEQTGSIIISSLMGRINLGGIST